MQNVKYGMVQEYSSLGVKNSILDVLHFFLLFKHRQILWTLSGSDGTRPDSVRSTWQRQFWNIERGMSNVECVKTGLANIYKKRGFLV